MLTLLVIYLFLGAAAGLLAGLFGVGGGVVIVPVLIYAFSQQGFSPDFLTHMAVGTSLAVICVSSASSTMAHHKKGMVAWPVVRSMAPGLLLGVILGVYVVIRIPGASLQWIIGVYLLFVALQMGFNLMPTRQANLPQNKMLAFAGTGIGMLSAMFGIGGGSLTVPFLSYFGVSMQRAVATSAACGIPIAVMGAVSNVYAGWAREDLPAGSAGYVFLPALVGIAVLSAPFARVGAKIAHQLPAHILKRLFAIFLVMIGSSLIYKGLG